MTLTDRTEVNLHMMVSQTEIPRFSLRVIMPILLLVLASGRLCAQASQAYETVDASTRRFVIEQALTQLRANYIFENTAEKMAQAIGARQRAGEYDTVNSGPEFAALLTRHFQEVSGDKHLRVTFSTEPMKDARSRPPGTPASPFSAEDEERLRPEWTRQNCEFRQAANLAGNVGYLKIDRLLPPSVCGKTAVAAMNFVADSDALIIDVRDVQGGVSEMQILIASYLFRESIHLNDLYERVTDVTIQYWTQPFVSGRKFLDKPVYVLTSNRTFSGGESLAYNLQTIGRARVVGETTAGGANPSQPLAIDSHFAIWVPYARAVNPISHTNWDGVGVKPDVAVPETIALATAHKLALQGLAAGASDVKQREAIQQQIERLDQEIKFRK